MDWQNLLIRDDLPPLPQGSPSPRDMAEDELDRAVEALERWESLDKHESVDHEPDPELSDAAYDLLSSWMALERFRPDILPSLIQILPTLRKRVRTDARALEAGATRVLNPEAWLRQAQELADDIEERQQEPMGETFVAIELFEDLDQADLLRCALLSLAHQGLVRHDSGLQLQERLLPCLDWLRSNARVFFAAQGHIRCLAFSCRSDLEQNDPLLASTLSKLDLLLARFLEFHRQGPESLDSRG